MPSETIAELIAFRPWKTELQLICLLVFGSARIKKSALCLILKEHMKIQGEGKQRKMHPTRVHIFEAIFCYKTEKMPNNGIYVGCGSV